MTGFAVKGWCPDAWHPMISGDGLLVRVKPRLGRLTREQALALCDAAATCGSGLIDLTRRANLQIRGVAQDRWPLLIQRLIALELMQPEPALEARRNVLVAPDWQENDDTHRIANALLARIGEWPDLPGKVGFVIDAGPAAVLTGASGDFRVERGTDGSLILRADGCLTGSSLSPGTEADALIALAHWFAASGAAAAGRMARWDAELPAWAKGAIAPAMAEPGHVLGTGHHPSIALAFGLIEASELAILLESGSASGLRTTPWRRLLIEGAAAARTHPSTGAKPDPLPHVEACPGAPLCAQATVETRALARRLAPYVSGRLHVSGCAKGCACSQVADVTLTGRNGRFDLVLAGKAGSPPSRSGLSASEILAHFGAV